MDFLKQYGIQLAILIVAVIILFQTCNKKEYAPVYIFPNSTDKAIEKKLDSLLKKEYTIENNSTVIKNNYKNETQNFINLPDSSKPNRIRELTRDLLK